MKKRAIVLLAVLLLLACVACGGPGERRDKFYHKGKALYEQGDYVKAALEVKNALQVDPKFTDGYLLLGKINLAQKKFRAAYGAFAKAVSLDAEKYEAQLGMGKLLLLGREPAKALEKADLVLKAEPDNEKAKVLRAGCLLAEKKEAEAEKILQGLIDAGSELSDVYLMEANIQIRRSRLDQAEKLLQTLLKRHEKLIAARLLLADILEKEGKLDEVAAELKENAETLEWMARFYGRICRNCALQYMAAGGIYITGGVAAKLPEIITHPAFKKTFGKSETMAGLLEKIPVFLNLNEESGLWGAAFYGQNIITGNLPKKP
jgi:tetratricopeptide (TPR) repeat protein